MVGDDCIKEDKENTNREREEGRTLKQMGEEPSRNRGELRAKRNLNEGVFARAGEGVCQVTIWKCKWKFVKKGEKMNGHYPLSLSSFPPILFASFHRTCFLFLQNCYL